MIGLEVVEPRAGQSHQLEKRRSIRVSLGEGLDAKVEELGSAWLTGLGLGGATLETERKPLVGGRYQLLIDYKGSSVRTELLVRETVLRELYYSAAGPSKLRFRTRARFPDPSVEALNLIYRIMNDHWDPLSEPDDTRAEQHEALPPAVNEC